MSHCLLVVPAAVTVAVCNSSVSALRCAFGLRLGTWQCCGKSLADPKIRYARVSGTKYKLHLSFGWGASKSTTQGGNFDLNMYITFDCAEIAAF